MAQARRNAKRNENARRQRFAKLLSKGSQFTQTDGFNLNRIIFALKFKETFSISSINALNFLFFPLKQEGRTQDTPVSLHITGFRAYLLKERSCSYSASSCISQGPDWLADGCFFFSLLVEFVLTIDHNIRLTPY